MSAIPQQYLFFVAGLALGLFLGWLAGSRNRPQATDAITLPAPVADEPDKDQNAAGVSLVVNGNTVNVSTDAMAEIQGLILAGQKIEAIKHLRLVTGLNLAAAKSVVESLEKVIS